MDGTQESLTHGTISSAIFSTNFPTLVPPYFCTNHLAAGSAVFWCILGGVEGPPPLLELRSERVGEGAEEERDEEGEEGGVMASGPGPDSRQSEI